MDTQESDEWNNEKLPEQFIRTISLKELPVEVFLYICSFVDSPTLVHGLSLVCKQFNGILKDELMWKKRINRLWGKARFPILPPDTDDDDETFWKSSCLMMEKKRNLWSNADNIESFSLQNYHYAAVDAVLLVNKGQTCISGGRDRQLIAWNFSTIGEEPSYQASVGQGHDGWIWAIASMHDTIYSCSWDKTVRSWDINTGGILPLRTDTLNVQGALLCINACPETNCLAVGSFCKNVMVIDPRTGTVHTKYQSHHRAVIQVTMNSNYIISASEDRTVVVWDMRAGQAFKTMEIAEHAFPMSMHRHNGGIYVGDSNGKIHIINEKDDFNLVESHQTEHNKGITGIQSTTGAIITSSLDHTARFISPTTPPHHFACLRGAFGEICAMHYLNNVLALSGDGAVQIWRPKTVFNHSL